MQASRRGPRRPGPTVPAAADPLPPPRPERERTGGHVSTLKPSLPLVQVRKQRGQHHSALLGGLFRCAVDYAGPACVGLRVSDCSGLRFAIAFAGRVRTVVDKEGPASARKRNELRVMPGRLLSPARALPAPLKALTRSLEARGVSVDVELARDIARCDEGTRGLAARHVLTKVGAGRIARPDGYPVDARSGYVHPVAVNVPS